MPSASASLSIYRGLSRRGRGEGPGRPISHGEQYLAGTADELFARGEWLEQARPWLTLDLDPDDQRRIGPRLEAWSCWTLERWRGVAQLTLAGVYDQRSAYFAHARVWPAEAYEGDFDPGAHLGRSEAFDPPFRDDERAEGRPAPPPVLVRFEQVRAEPETAVALLAALYEGMRRGGPVVMAAPHADFVAGGPLPALVSFARAALPLELKRDCRLRVYTRRPEVFLERLGAHLIVVPQDLAERALTTRRDTLLLDRAGTRLAGPRPDARTAAYAKAVVARALERPQSLLAFSARAQRHLGAEPPEDVRLVRLTYYVTAGLAADAATRAGLCTHFAEVARGGAPLPWPRIVAPQEWCLFPRPARVELVLAPDGGESLAALQREVQATLEAPLEEAELQAWWNAADDAKLTRLLTLAGEAPRLLPPELAAACLVGVSLERALGLGLATRLVAIERHAGTLGRRHAETAALASTARREPAALGLLVEATIAGQLAAAWVRTYLAEADPAQVVGLAPLVLSDHARWPVEVVERLLARLALVTPLPSEVQAAVQQAGARLDGVREWRLGLALAHLLAPGDANEPARRVLDALPQLDPAARAELVARVLRGACRGLPPHALVVDGGLRDPSLRDEAAQLVHHADVGARLSADALLELGERLPADDEPAVRALFARLDEHVRRDAERATAALVRRRWWSAWRAHTQLDPGEVHRAALAWLRCPVWRRPDAPPATLEAWRRVLADADKLHGAEVAGLSVERGDPSLAAGAAPGRTWPLIPPFESDQLDELCHRVGFGGLAEIALAVSAEDVGADPACAWERDLDARWHREEVARGRDDDHTAQALRWLMGRSAPTLDLAASQWLCSQAEHRTEQALAAREAAVLARLENELHRAVPSADDPPLWSRASFLNGLAQSLSHHDVRAQLTPTLVAHVEERLSDTPPEPRRAAEPARADTLWHAGLQRLAVRVDAGVEKRMNTRALPGRIVAALLAGNGRGIDGCWSELTARFQDDGGTLIEAVAADLETNPAFRPSTADETPSVWGVFKQAVVSYPELLGAQRTGATRVVPLLPLATALLGPGTTGLACQRLATLELPHGRDATYHDAGWWTALLATAEARRGASQPPGTAVALVGHGLPMLETDARKAADEAIGHWLAATMRRPIEQGCQMQDSVTLFGGEPLRPLEFTQPSDVTVKGQRAQILVYGATTGKPNDRRDFKEVSQFDAYVSDLAQRLTDGSVVVSVLSKGAKRAVQVKTPQFQPARVLKLRPGYPAELLDPSEGQPILLDPGSRLIVPTTAEGATHLAELLKLLESFSLDVAWLTLAAVCEPALDLRLRRLEEHLPRLDEKDRTRERGAAAASHVGDAFAKVTQAARVAWDPVRNLVSGHALLWVACTLLLGLVALIAWDHAHDYSIGRAVTEWWSDKPRETPGTPDPTPRPTPSHADVARGDRARTTPLYTALDALRERLAQARDPRIGKLYSTHFVKLASLHAGDEERVVAEPDFAYGLVWLLAAQTAGSSIKWPEGGPVAGNASHEKAARAALRVVRGSLPPYQYSLLAKVTCRAFPGNPYVPGLPATNRAESAELPGGVCGGELPIGALEAVARNVVTTRESATRSENTDGGVAPIEPTDRPLPAAPGRHHSPASTLPPAPADGSKPEGEAR